ncbi:MAG: molybdopterin-dependent oxidoreductase [Thermomicrobiales bacterium]|nr:molybdopterin-dependent oxidoreductase [Thermomicrobiales bacterium]
MNIHISRRVFSFALALVLGILSIGGLTTVAQEATPEASPVAGGSIEMLGLVESAGPLTLEALQALPQQSVDVTYQSGNGEQQHSYTGVLLSDALDLVGVAVDPDVRNDQLHLVALFTANDGYQVVISLGEIDPGFGGAPMLLAWEEDGALLEGEDGPLRLIVPGDVRGGRYISGIVSIEIIRVAEAGAH